MRAADPLITADEFLENRFDLPESGQWSELVEGRLVHRQPPDLNHGNAVLNLSKALAEFTVDAEGYPCFDLGLLIQQHPDTVWFPAVTYFVGGRRFAEMDRTVTTTVPQVVMELASTSDRRTAMPARVTRYLEWSVDTVWIIDPAEQSVEIVSAGESNAFGAADEVRGTGVLSGLTLSVDQLFAEPSWWK